MDCHGLHAVQLQKDAAASEQCEHCGKQHAGECCHKPGIEKRNRAEKKALKTAAKLSQVKSGEDAGSEVEESDVDASEIYTIGCGNCDCPCPSAQTLP